MKTNLKEVFGSAEQLRNITLEFTDVQSAHLCCLFIRDSGFLFDNLREIETKVYLQLHFSDVPELLENLKSQDGEYYWILENLVSVSLEKVSSEAEEAIALP
jgi:hypothetical protein